MKPILRLRYNSKSVILLIFSFPSCALSPFHFFLISGAGGHLVFLILAGGGRNTFEYFMGVTYGFVVVAFWMPRELGF